MKYILNHICGVVSMLTPCMVARWTQPGQTIDHKFVFDAFLLSMQH